MSDNHTYSPDDAPIRTAYDHTDRARRLVEDNGPKTLKAFIVVVMLEVASALLENMEDNDD